MLYSTVALGIGFILDIVFGDPVYFWHPIRLIGHLISLFEKGLRKILPKTKSGEITGGVFLVLFVALISVVLPAIILFFAYKIHFMAGIAIESIFCYQLLSIKGLKTESMKVYKELEKDDLISARRALSMIVGRDTEKLTQDEVTKAAVETVAENTSDGIIAPIFYMILGGAVFGFFYKAINTMDSMVGYKNERYINFGKVAAKMDDFLNYIPARMSAVLMIFATAICRYNFKNAVRIYLRDRYNHASPNSAHTEAVTAGALKIQLAGDACYFGKTYKKKFIGDFIRNIEIKDIKRANILLYLTAILGIFILTGIKLTILFTVG